MIFFQHEEAKTLLQKYENELERHKKEVDYKRDELEAVRSGSESNCYSYVLEITAWLFRALCALSHGFFGVAFKFHGNLLLHVK